MEDNNETKEIEEAFQVCTSIIENPPNESRIVRQAIQGATHLCACRADFRSVLVSKLLQVIGDPYTYTSMLRRYAIKCLASLSRFDAQFTVSTVLLLLHLIKRENEKNQSIRKGAICALSRIGRKYPVIQEILVPIHLEYYRSPNETTEIKCEVAVGFGRFAQSNTSLRSLFAEEWLQCCRSKEMRVRIAGIKGLGHAVCSMGNVLNDESLEAKCFEVAVELLQGSDDTLPNALSIDNQALQLSASSQREPPNSISTFVKDKTLQAITDQKKAEKAHILQYAAAQALGLLLRAYPNKWWPKIAPVFQEILSNPNYNVLVKTIVIRSYGKIAYYVTPHSPHFNSLKDLLFELSEYKHNLIAEAAACSLCDLGLAHPDLYDRVKEFFKKKMRSPLSKSSEYVHYCYLKMWCKLLARDYQPLINLCSCAISTYPIFEANIIFRDSEAFDPKKRLIFLDGDLDETELKEEEEKKSQRIKLIARDKTKLLELCAAFSPTVLESLLLLTRDAAHFHDKEFLHNLRHLITENQCANARNQILLNQQNQHEFISLFNQILSLDLSLQECIVVALKFPEVIDNPLWMSNFKVLVMNLMSQHQKQQSNPLIQQHTPLSLQSNKQLIDSTAQIRPSNIPQPITIQQLVEVLISNQLSATTASTSIPQQQAQQQSSTPFQSPLQSQLSQLASLLSKQPQTSQQPILAPKISSQSSLPSNALSAVLLRAAPLLQQQQVSQSPPLSSSQPLQPNTLLANLIQQATANLVKTTAAKLLQQLISSSNVTTPTLSPLPLSMSLPSSPAQFQMSSTSQSSLTTSTPITTTNTNPHPISHQLEPNTTLPQIDSLPSFQTLSTTPSSGLHQQVHSFPQRSRDPRLQRDSQLSPPSISPPSSPHSFQSSDVSVGKMKSHFDGELQQHIKRQKTDDMPTQRQPPQQQQSHSLSQSQLQCSFPQSQLQQQSVPSPSVDESELEEGELVEEPQMPQQHNLPTTTKPLKKKGTKQKKQKNRAEKMKGKKGNIDHSLTSQQGREQQLQPPSKEDGGKSPESEEKSEELDVLTILKNIGAESELAENDDVTTTPTPTTTDTTSREGEDKSQQTKMKTRKASKTKPKAQQKSIEEKKQEVCKFWLTRSCLKGQDCPYLHVGGTKINEICRFYRSGTCRRGDQCLYSHDLSKEACKYMTQLGHCPFGSRCRFSHIPEIIEAARKATTNKESQKKTSLSTQTLSASTENGLLPDTSQSPPSFISSIDSTTALLGSSTQSHPSTILEGRDPRQSTAKLESVRLPSEKPPPSFTKPSPLFSDTKS